MSHIIYQTEGIVLSKSDFGEADRTLVVFTENFGKIKAVVRGVRHLKSKLRHNLDLFSFSRFALVAAKNGWRLVDAEEIAGRRAIFSSSEKLALFSRFAGFLNRMVQGEEENAYLWGELKNVFNILREKNLTKEKMKDLEIVSLLRVLHNLGYIEKENYNSRKQAVSIINKAIKESML